jgi:NADP-dependent 3-hydroxy acid dehydrogenase YdfG
VWGYGGPRAVQGPLKVREDPERANPRGDGQGEQTRTGHPPRLCAATSVNTGRVTETARPRTQTTRPVAVVTGASSGIGASTARRLAVEGFEVVCAARRGDRIEALAAEIDGRAIRCDVTSSTDVAALAEEVGERCDLLVNNAGGALGADPVAESDLEQWRTMYEVNVIGVVAVTKALLPALVASQGQIVVMGSTAGLVAYEGGGGYVAAKFAVHSVVDTLRLELWDQPVRVCEIAPGMVRSEGFALTRFGGDRARAESVYAGVAEPLTAEDIADCVAWVATRPSHVNIDRMIVRPRAQAANHKVHRVLG